MNVTEEVFGKTPEGERVDLYTLTNSHGLRVKIMTHGATITSVETPDRDGRTANVTLSLDSLDDYLKGHPSLGSTVGRYANRIANGKLRIDGQEYTLTANEKTNHLHGGAKGFDKVVWKAVPVKADGSVGVKFTYVSEDGEEGYPGQLTVSVTYSLTDSDELRMEYEAETDEPTVVNLTNHAYWNLAGGKRNVLEHILKLNAGRFLPADDKLIPTGELKPVDGTPFDFNEPKTIGSRIDRVENGYDLCYVLNKNESSTEPTFAAKVVEPSSGRVMEIFTTQPGIQFYTANFLDGTLTGGGMPLNKHFGFCLETQHYPDSPNRPDFPDTVLRPGEKYHETTIHRFSIEK